ncbi:hypothetical protein [Pedobacter arcticus]|uniref:hypothetical protein n=1 Tax=Pedobacter arcticus TaxID=752140 RepID=UPI00036C2784|nr:hypothetical protein [Pedobacter arcticus]
MMNKSQILKKIGNIIEELGEQQQYLASTNKINLLELELFTANADFLIDHIEILKKLNDQRFEIEAHSQPISERQPPIIRAPEPEIAQKPVEIPVEEEKERKFSFSFDDEPTEMVFDFEKKIAVEEVFDRPLNNDERRLLEEKSRAPMATPEEFIVLDDTENQFTGNDLEEDIEPFLMVKQEETVSTANSNDILTNVIDKDVEIPVKEEEKGEPIKEQKLVEREQEPVASSAQKQPSAFDQQASAPTNVSAPSLVKEDRPLTLNEMLSAKLNQGNGQQRQTKKLDDLKTAISINDKMVFIKELFNGYNLAYSEAIEIVNRFESFEAADNFLQKNYSLKNDWESKQITVARFYEYLHKKFVM